MKDIFSTPERLLERHDSYALCSVISASKEHVMKALFNEFAENLYQKMTKTSSTSSYKLCTLYYMSEVRGFTLKAKKEVDGNVTISFDNVFLGAMNEISPIMPNIGLTNENSSIIKFLDPCLRKILHDSGWNVGIKITKAICDQKIVVYETRESI